MKKTIQEAVAFAAQRFEALVPGKRYYANSHSATFYFVRGECEGTVSLDFDSKIQPKVRMALPAYNSEPSHDFLQLVHDLTIFSFVLQAELNLMEITVE